MPKITFLPEQMDDKWPNTTITLRDIAKASTLFPVNTALNKLHGFDAWGAQEIADYLVASRLAKVSQGKSHGKVQATKKIQRSVKTRDMTFQQRMDALTSPFDRDTITPNDFQMFSNLAEIQMQMDIITEQLHTPEIAADVSKLKVLNETYAKLSGESRQLQSALGIDRSSRETQVDTGAEIKRMVKGAHDMLEANSIHIRCKECENNEVVLNQGFILFHFKGDVSWSWDSICPRCGAKLHYGYDKGKDNGGYTVTLNSPWSGQEQTQGTPVRLAPPTDVESDGGEQPEGGEEEL